MTFKTFSSLLYVVTVLSLYFTNYGLAQTNTENFAALDFDFSRTGARAAGKGGASIANVEDPTSIEANPAGLSHIKTVGLLVELRGIAYTQKIFNFTHFGTVASFNLSEGRFLNSLVSPSIVSLVFPVANIKIAVFRHELMNIENSFFTRGAFVPGFTDGTSYAPTTSQTNIKVVNWGLSGARKVGNASFGLSMGFSQIDVNSSLSRFQVEIYDDRTLASRAVIHDHDEDFFVNFGIQYRLSSKINLGGVFKLRPNFKVTQQMTTIAFPADSASTGNIRFNIPTSFGLGLSYNPINALSFALDLVRINYSSLTDDISITERPDIFSRSDYSLKDGTEFRFGVEHNGALHSIGYMIRGGLLIIPDNQISFTGNLDGSVERQLHHSFFQAGEQEVHYTLGVGIKLNNILQFDAAYVFSEQMDEFLASVQYMLD